MHLTPLLRLGVNYGLSDRYNFCKNHDCHLLCRPLPGYIVLVGRKHVIQAMTERSYMARFDFKLLKVKIRQKNLQENSLQTILLLTVTLKAFLLHIFLSRTLMIWYDPVVLSCIQRNSPSQSLSHMLNKVFFLLLSYLHSWV